MNLCEETCSPPPPHRPVVPPHGDTEEGTSDTMMGARPQGQDTEWKEPDTFIYVTFCKRQNYGDGGQV